MGAVDVSLAVADVDAAFGRLLEVGEDEGEPPCLALVAVVGRGAIDSLEERQESEMSQDGGSLMDGLAGDDGESPSHGAQRLETGDDLGIELAVEHGAVGVVSFVEPHGLVGEM